MRVSKSFRVASELKLEIYKLPLAHPTSPPLPNHPAPRKTAMGYSYEKQKTNSSIKVLLKKSIDFSHLVLFQFHYTDEEGSYDKADKEATAKLEELRKAKPKPFKTDVQCRAIVALACYCCSELHSPAMTSYVASLEGNPHNYRTLISGGGEGGFITFYSVTFRVSC